VFAGYERPDTMVKKMVKKTAKVPDAWEDDWETQADNVAAAEEAESSETAAPLTKAERLAKHAESNKKLWESAYVYPPPPTLSAFAFRKQHAGWFGPAREA
jgi:hypothetical protein